jgi:hypothetical protein
MPQLVKGGKYIFGWAVIQSDGRIRIPDETYDEYRFSETGTVILLSGSKTSGGFSLHKPDSLAETKPGHQITDLIGYNKESGSFTTKKLEVIKSGSRLIGWTMLDREKYFKLSSEWLDLFALKSGTRLLVGRGSGLGPAFIAKGAIYQEALKHPGLFVF